MVFHSRRRRDKGKRKCHHMALHPELSKECITYSKIMCHAPGMCHLWVWWSIAELDEIGGVRQKGF